MVNLLLTEHKPVRLLNRALSYMSVICCYEKQKASETVLIIAVLKTMHVNDTVIVDHVDTEKVYH